MVLLNRIVLLSALLGGVVVSSVLSEGGSKWCCLHRRSKLFLAADDVETSSSAATDGGSVPLLGDVDLGDELRREKPEVSDRVSGASESTISSDVETSSSAATDGGTIPLLGDVEFRLDEFRLDELRRDELRRDELRCEKPEVSEPSESRTAAFSEFLRHFTHGKEDNCGRSPAFADVFLEMRKGVSFATAVRECRARGHVHSSETVSSDVETSSSAATDGGSLLGDVDLGDELLCEKLRCEKPEVSDRVSGASESMRTASFSECLKQWTHWKEDNCGRSHVPLPAFADVFLEMRKGVSFATAVRKCRAGGHVVPLTRRTVEEHGSETHEGAEIPRDGEELEPPAIRHLDAITNDKQIALALQQLSREELAKELGGVTLDNNDAVGSGSQANVFFGHDRGGRPVAVKISLYAVEAGRACKGTG